MADQATDVGFVRRSTRVRVPVIVAVAHVRSTKNDAAKKKPVKKSPPPPKTRRGRDKRAVNPKYLIDAQTGQQVWITAVSVQDIESAKKQKCSPWKSSQPRLVTVESLPQRAAVYARAAKALEKLEQLGLPRYGGRPWLCQITISDNKNKGTAAGPYFCFGPSGLLELAAWPTILQKRLVAPSFPGHKSNAASETDEPLEEPALEEDDLKHREPSAVSRLATSEAWRVPLPSFHYRWISPLNESFHSRSAVWKHAEELCKKEGSIERVLKGILPSGRMVKLRPCTQKVALETGKMRFERDGLWIVGQEEFRAREQLWGTTTTVAMDLPPVDDTTKRRASALSCYIESNRKDHKEKRVWELKKKANEPVVETDANAASAAPLNRSGSRIIELTSFVGTVDGWTCAPGLAPIACAAMPGAAMDTAPERSSSEISVSSSEPPSYEKMQAIPLSESLHVISPVPVAGAQTMSGLQSFGPDSKVTAHSSMHGARVTSSIPLTTPSISSASPSIADCTPDVLAPLNPRTVSFTLRDAEIELRSMWKKLSKDEQAKWQAIADRKNQTVTKESSISIVSDESADESGREVAPRSDSPHSLACIPQSEPLTAEARPPCDKNENSAWDEKKREEFQRSRRWCLTPAQVQQCYKAGMDHYDQIMHTVKARDLIRELQDGFDLLRERGRGRYDMELPVFEESQYFFFNNVQKAPWMPIVRQILGKEVVLIHKGIFLSLPGAERQPYHQDGPHLNDQVQKPCHAINVFVPLVDLTIENGPTEFCLGSHILGYDMYREELSEIPTVAAGTPVIFDYRLGHRGLNNDSSTCRQILYCTYAAAAGGKEFRDSVNFSRKRYHRIGDLIEKGLSREERAQKRVRVKEDSVMEKAIAESLSASSAGVSL